MPYIFEEVDATDPGAAHTIHHFNALCPEIFPELEARHLENGYWWIAYCEGEPVAFAGLVPMSPFDGYGYLKRCYVLPDHHGHGLQLRMMVAREVKARQIGWTHLVSECGAGNSWSASNFRRAGFDLTEPEQKWGEPGSVYWIKSL
jgi:GNAT superfamily N-acetyltransferase